MTLDKNPEELRHLIASCIPKLRSVARGLTGQATTADDLVQSTLERAMTRLDQVYDSGRIDRWLLTILHSRWVDEVRRSNRMKNVQVQLSLVKSIERTGDRSGEQNTSTAMDLEKGMAKLSVDQREVISLVYIAGNNYSEAAEILDLPVGTVASRVARAKEKLAKFFREENTHGKRSSSAKEGMNAQ